MTFPLSWQNCNPKRLPLPPNKYVTVIPVQSTKSIVVFAVQFSTVKKGFSARLFNIPHFHGVAQTDWSLVSLPDRDTAANNSQVSASLES